MPTFTPLRHRSRLGGGLAALLLLLTSPAAFAQLSGAYTINSTQPTAGTNYASFTAAAAALTTGGVSGPVTFTVSGGPYTEQVSLGPITGSSAVSRVTFNGGGSVIQFGSNTATQRAVVTLNGADFVTINNLTVDATVGGTSTATYGWGIQLLNNSENNVISNCTVTAALTGTTTNFAGIVSNASTTSLTTTGSTASQNLTLQNNTVTGGYSGITVVGSGNTGAPVLGVQITGNTVRDSYDAGIYISYLGGAQVTGNDVSRPTRTGASSFYGLNMNVGTSGTTVAKNRFHQAFPAGSTTTSGAYGIYLFTLAAATATAPNVIANNLIYDMSGSVVYGIFNGSSDNCKYYYNTIDINDQANASTGGGFGFYQTTGLNVEFRNNIVRLSRTGTGLNYAILLSSVVPSFVSNNNDLVGSGSTYRTGFFQTSPYATLADWSTANGGAFDQNSVSVEPQFVSVSTGNLRPTAVALNGIGAPLTAVTDDFTGATRGTTPDLGAYELTPPANTPSVSLRSIDSPAAPLALGARTVTVTISNNGTAPLTTVQMQYVFNGAAAVSQTLTPAGGLAVGAAQSFSFTVPVTLISGRNALTVTASAPNGSTAVSSSVSRIFYTPLVGTYTINKLATGSATNFQSFADAATTLNAGGISGSVRLNVLNGPYQEQFSLGQVAGVSATDTIVVDGGTAKQRLAYIGPQMTQPAAVLLNGTDYLTLQNLTIDVASSPQYGIGVSLVGQALNNRIKNCTILASSASTLTTVNAGIAASGSVTSTSSGGDVSGLRIENDSISGGAYGITLTGISATSRSTNVRVTGCVVRNFFNYGIYLANYSGARVIGNNIHRETRISTSTFWGVYVTGCVGLAIERNRIHDPNTASGSALPANGIHFTSSPATAGQENDVVNNLIYNFSSFGTACALYNSGSSFARYYHNTVVMDNPSAAQTAIIGFQLTSSATNVDFRNNLVLVTQSATQGRYAMLIDNTSSGFISNYNNLYVGTGTTAITTRYGNTSYFTLADWAVSNGNAFDQNSVQSAVVFPVAGSWQPFAPALNGAGTPATLARVPRDFASVLRTSPPDIGAYEFDVVANDVDLVSIDAPVSPALLGSNPVTVTIRNGGNGPLTSVTLSYVLNSGTPVTQVFTGLTLAFNATQQLTFTQGVTLPFGTHTITVTGSLPNGQPDAVATNNTRTITIQQLIPTNDEPCGAIALGTAPLTSTTLAATTTAQPTIITPACSSAAQPKDVWFTLVPSGTSTTLTITGAPAGLVRFFTTPNCSAGPFTQVFCASSGASNTAFAAPVVVTGLTAGQRYYVAVSGYGSNDTGGQFTIAATAVLAARTSNSAALAVFPNPSSTGQLTLRLAASAGTGSVALVNSLGQLVRRQPLTNAAEQPVSTIGLAAGLYTLRVQLGSEIITRKVVLQ